MVKKASKKLPVSKIIGENYDDGTPVPAHEVKKPIAIDIEIESPISPGEEVFNEMVDALDEIDRKMYPWEQEDVLLVCSQCGRATRVPPLEKVPDRCACGLIYDHDHELTPTEIVIDEPTTLVVRKMARKW